MTLPEKPMARQANSRGRGGTLAFGLLLFVVLLLALFPYGPLARRLVARTAAAAGVDVAYRELGYVFPLGVALRPAEISLSGGRGVEPVFRGSVVTVRPRIGPLLRGRLVLDLDARACTRPP